jgi:hypothetical protein
LTKIPLLPGSATLGAVRLNSRSVTNRLQRHALMENFGDRSR